MEVYGPHIVLDGLVFYLDAANVKSYPGSGTVCNDLLGNGNGGTLIGSTFISSGIPSFYFDGINDYIDLGINSNLDILNFTIIVWAKSNSFTNYQNLIFKGSNIGQYGISINSSGDWTVQPNESGGFTGDIISLDTWNCFVGSYDGNSIRAYRNGIIKLQYTSTQSHYGTSTIIGSDLGNDRYFNGEIANVLIYNRALTDSEVVQNYNAMRTRFL